MVGHETSNGEDVTMSTFPVQDYVAEHTARLEKMSKDFGATLPQDMAAAISLMSHPAAGVAALTAIGFGVAGQAFGMWAGAVAGAAEASQRLFAPLAPNVDKPSAASQSPATVRHWRGQTAAEGGGEDRTWAGGRAKAERWRSRSPRRNRSSVVVAKANRRKSGCGPQGGEAAGPKPSA